MAMKLYSTLAAWWSLMSPPEDYAEEAAALAALLMETAGKDARLLELGCGGGHVASHLKTHCVMTLVDCAPAMLAMSRRRNPECVHQLGDMRSLRLDERFDAVLIHDAISHMFTHEALAAALRTAAHHLRPGGVALFCPDWTTETFTPGVSMGGVDAPHAHRGMRYLEWTRPHDGQNSYPVDIAYLLRDGETVRAERDQMRLGVFSRAQWRSLCEAAGFTRVERKEVGSRDVFLALMGMPRLFASRPCE